MLHPDDIVVPLLCDPPLPLPPATAVSTPTTSYSSSSGSTGCDDDTLFPIVEWPDDTYLMGPWEDCLAQPPPPPAVAFEEEDTFTAYPHLIRSASFDQQEAIWNQLDLF